jgi:PAS domain S-box-containing protein
MDSAISVMAVAGTQSLLAVVFLAAWWLAGVAGPQTPLLWTVLTAMSTFAVGYLALNSQCRRQSLLIRQLEAADDRLRAELIEQTHFSSVAQQAAEENRKTIWKVFKASPDPMAVLDGGPDGLFLAVNQAFTSIFGYPRDEILGKTPVQLSLLANPEKLAEFSRRLEPEGYVANAETAFRAKDGGVIWGLLSVVTVDVAGKPYVHWIVRDITDRKRIETELIAARTAAEAASRAKSEFLSSMSHEIRTPMNAVLGMAQLLAETELSADQRHYLDLMVANGNSLLDLINSILDLAKIESGRMQVEHSEFDLTEVVDKTMATFGVRAHSKGLELVARVARDVPEKLVGDPLRLRQVLTNLLGNAIKFTDCGEIVLDVRNSAVSNGLVEVKFTVADTGIGIPPDKLDSIFRNFTQADSSTTRKYGGSGLGLAIAHRLVGLMGGRISVESEPGKGSRFSFTARFGKPSGATASMSGAAPGLAGCRALIADDSSTNRMALRETLAGTGAEIDEAANGHNAYRLARQAAEEGHPYQLVLLDMAMPGLDGFEVARRLRDYGLPVKSLLPMLSSDELKPQITRLQQLGLATYLVKPVTRKDLLASIRTLLDEAHNDRRPSAADARTDIGDEAVKRILVAEDSPDNRLVIAAYLRHQPYQVDFAEDGKQALRKFTANLYDLVLMDVQMPEMDGLETTRAIRRWEFERGRVPTPIVALTAYALEDDVRRALAAGCNLHISKPLKKQALIECIQQMQRGDNVERLSPRPPYYSH